MATPEVQSILRQLGSTSDSTQTINEIISSSNAETINPNLKATIDTILGESISIVIARPLLSTFVDSLSRIPPTEVKISAGEYAIEQLRSRVVSFEEQDAQLREILADAFTAEESYIDAAKVLQGIQLDSSQRKIGDDVKVRMWMRICRLYLEVDDTTSAEAYLNRAKNLLYKIEDKELHLVFQLSQARILDARCRFLDASQAYHQVSLSTALDEEDRQQSLSKAITCAVLAGAGPSRSKLLAKLFKDENATELREFGILEKMFLDRLISPTEVKQFADQLAPHQLARTSDGSTVVAKAMIEHNLLGASRLYSNIGVAELGRLIGLDAEKAEEYAARMLEQGRLDGYIDQIDGVVFFRGGDSGSSVSGEKSTDVAAAASRKSAPNLRKWDASVQGLTEEVERVASLLQAQYPVLVEATRVH